MRRVRPLVTSLAACVALSLVAACGGRTAPPPGPGTVRGAAPDLRGVRVLLLPIQQAFGLQGDPDAELLYGLRDRGREVLWEPPSTVEAALARSPGLQARTHGLPVGDFLTAEVLRIGDPLYGEIRRMTALVDAAAVLIPVRASLEPQPEGEPKVRFVTALVESRTGRVIWFSVLEGDAAAADDPRGIASAVEVVARTLLWYVNP